MARWMDYETRKSKNDMSSVSTEYFTLLRDSFRSFRLLHPTFLTTHVRDAAPILVLYAEKPQALKSLNHIIHHVQNVHHEEKGTWEFQILLRFE